MASVNKVILIGNLGRDPELRYTQGGQAVANFSVATTEKFSGRDGTPQERTEWHRIVVWGKQGENCAQYLSKGRSVYVEGSLRTQEWEDREGNKRRTTEVVAQRVQFLGSRRDAAGGPAGDTRLPEAPSSPPSDSTSGPPSDSTSGPPSDSTSGPPSGSTSGPPPEDDVPF